MLMARESYLSDYLDLACSVHHLSRHCHLIYANYEHHVQEDREAAQPTLTEDVRNVDRWFWHAQTRSC
jgi:hypothetical protein